MKRSRDEVERKRRLLHERLAKDPEFVREAEELQRHIDEGERSLLSDEEIRDRVLSDPDVQRRVAEALEEAKRPSPSPGISAEDLPEFLREHG
jgi:hypothetical protein